VAGYTGGVENNLPPFHRSLDARLGCWLKRTQKDNNKKAADKNNFHIKMFNKVPKANGVT
jgi:hypothetical protein